jgi:predicted RNase H-like nuclease (RuvC/YqgF family)
LKFGFVLDLEKHKPNNTGIIVGIVAAAVVGVAAVGISGKLIANKARARKILAEEREDEKEDKGSSRKDLAPKSSKSGF